MRRNIRTALTSMAMLAAAGTGVASAPAHAAADQYCAVIVGKERDADGFSKVLSEQCSTVSVQDAHQKSKAAGGAAMRADTLLLQEYEHANYDTAIYNFYGASGPCDSEGYSLRNYVTVAGRVSSMRGYNNCTQAMLGDPAGNYVFHSLPTAYVGDLMNDNVLTVKIWRG
ncbi:hypothetical protein Sme01_54040 [Sphaerisporangium melleum]|nr:hypothetical protein [Sphaerisporangium melleum]GII72928.1 hypothetical protein Sme01_54040 [Sphaerisporangium melleum]